ncbi:general stress protein 13 [Virgibacillus sp. NKC19-3]|uniref:S1 domain-containing post-transcriptional regulator GSP13 n=1 Tax=Virgibacillus saliphilus TaxID=2831674 RepID=UPI001C9BB8CB|nr:S1 domain-containing post-transcriptional regulator GSP13 [Virgibacillus sp. NKC19-3]MBY7143958.1 general stress protein 13 [Virgibacillus sp. NKC19-3]
MTNKFEVGQIVEGRVTGIQPYGAFVALDEEVQGLVHISEVTHGFVNDINDYLTVGDDVHVKILNVDEANNKFSLSIRATEEAPAKSATTQKSSTNKQQDTEEAGFNTLKDKLEEWIKQSKK